MYDIRKQGEKKLNYETVGQDSSLTRLCVWWFIVVNEKEKEY